MESWTEKKWYKNILYVLMIADVILGIIVGVSQGKSFWESIGIALLVIFFFAIGILFALFFSVSFVEIFVHWIRERLAKREAYFMVEHGVIFSPSNFGKTIIQLSNCTDREARHLLDELCEIYEKIGQLPSKKKKGSLYLRLIYPFLAPLLSLLKLNQQKSQET